MFHLNYPNCRDFPWRLSGEFPEIIQVVAKFFCYLSKIPLGKGKYLSQGCIFTMITLLYNISATKLRIRMHQLSLKVLTKHLISGTMLALGAQGTVSVLQKFMDAQSHPTQYVYYRKT